jgi:hypothetical protein
MGVHVARTSWFWVFTSFLIFSSKGAAVGNLRRGGSGVIGTIGPTSPTPPNFIVISLTTTLLIRCRQDPHHLLFAVSRFLHGFSLSKRFKGARFSRFNWSENPQAGRVSKEAMTPNTRKRRRIDPKDPIKQ